MSASQSSPLAPQPLLQPFAQWLLLVVVGVLLALPTVDHVWGIDRTPAPEENRVLATAPPAPQQLADWYALPAKLEAWFRDTFGLRNLLISWHSHWMLDVLGVSPNAQVLVGQNGWLYLGAANNVDTYRCLSPYTPQELRAEVAEVQRRQRWLAERKIGYARIWAPIKANVYPEHLPRGLSKLAQPCRLQQWVPAVRKAGIAAVDLTEPLRAARKTAPELLYHATDTHWNPRGAWQAYTALVPWLRKLLPQMRALQPADVQFRTAHVPGGDLARMIDQAQRYASDEPFLQLRQPLAQPVDPTKVIAGFVPTKGVNVAAFRCARCGNDLKVLVLHDSFGNNLRPYLAESVGTLVAAEFAPFDQALIERFAPDVVLEVHLERQLAKPRQ